MARSLIAALRRIDVTEVAPSIAVPTLVLHRKNELLPVQMGQWLAAHIPGARLVELEGTDHVCSEAQRLELRQKMRFQFEQPGPDRFHAVTHAHIDSRLHSIDAGDVQRARFVTLRAGHKYDLLLRDKSG